MTIPKVIYQSWKTKKLPEYAQKNAELLKKLNPDYKYELYDDNDCRKFLLDNFGKNYVNAFDALIPGAYKCDFWRYAILYVKGGVYIDIDLTPLVPFSEILPPTAELVSVSDRIMNGYPGIYQAFVATIPKHPILLNCLQFTFSNIANRIELSHNLSITGPALMAVAMNIYFGRELTNSPLPSGIYQKGKIILYRSDFTTFNYCYDLNGKPILALPSATEKTKMILSDATDYRKAKVYKDDFRSKLHNSDKVGFALAFLVIFILIVMVCKYRKLYLKCSNR